MIIDRASVKLQAKEIIRLSKPSMLQLALIYTLLSLLFGWLSLRLTGVDQDTLTKAMQLSSAGRTEAAMTILEKALPGPGASIMDLLLRLALSIVGVGFSLFVINTVRQTGPVFGNLLDGFGMLPRLLFLLVLQYAFIILWSLLFLIPGIIAAYRYSLAVYVMIDHPEYTAMDCLRESKRLTNGYKAQLFTLDLSFILWLLLTALPVLGYAAQVYVTPYMETARVLYYERIRLLQNSDSSC